MKINENVVTAIQLVEAPRHGSDFKKSLSLDLSTDVELDNGYAIVAIDTWCDLYMPWRVKID